MKYYIDIQIKPDEDMSLYFIRNKVFTKLHKTLHDLKQTSIGVSFPNYKLKLGNIVRLHGDKNALEMLQKTKWLGGLIGYCDVSDITPVPETIKGYRQFSRIRPTMTMAKLAKRVLYQKRTGALNTSQDIEAYTKQYKAKMFATGLDKPYLELQSHSNGHYYRVYITIGELQDIAVKGLFNRFGLSKAATIPWF